MGDVLAAQELDDTALAAAVGSHECNSVAHADVEADIPADRTATVVDGHALQLRQPFGVEGGLEELQLVAALDVFQEPGLLLDGGVLPLFDGLGTGHGLRRLCALVGTVIFRLVHLDGVNAEFGSLCGVRPAGLLPCRLLQPGDLPLQLLILRLLESILSGLVLPPCGEIAPADLNVRPVDGENVIHAAVQERAVMGHQNEAPLAIQVPAHQLTALNIQVVRRLVDQQEVVLLGKQHRKLQFCLFAVAERSIGTVQNLILQPQLVHLTSYTPVFVVGVHGLHSLDGELSGVCHMVGKVGKGHRSGNAAPVLVLPQKQIQKGGLAPAIAPGEAQPPVGVQLKADIFEDVFIAAVVGKG